jgi:hypothetical protein
MIDIICAGMKVVKCIKDAIVWDLNIKKAVITFIILNTPSLLHSFCLRAGGLRNRNTAAFCLLKKYAPHFFNPASGGTRQKEAAYPVTGKN